MTMMGNISNQDVVTNNMDSERQFTREAVSVGLAADDINRPSAKATWYRPDGKVIPNLPVDPYHVRLYQSKGWSLVPPEIKPAVSPLDAALAELLKLGGNI